MKRGLPALAAIVVMELLCGCSAKRTHAKARLPDPYGIRFAEEAAARGIRYQWPPQPKPMRNLEAFGVGCAFFDYDNDGFQDVLLVSKPHPILYRNRGDGTFEDVTHSTKLDNLRGDWKGCAIGDFEGNGTLGILLTGYRCLALLRNDDGRRFVDVTKQAGLSPTNRGHWGASAGFMDLAGHGRMDLVLLNYVVFGPHEPQYCELRPGIRSGCPPATYKPEFGELWENVGGGRFRNVTEQSGMKATHGKCLVVAFMDLMGNGRMSFYIGNDGTPADFMFNEGHMHFTNIGLPTGLAWGELPGHAMAAMGADWADYNRDGRLDLAVSGFSDESYSVVRNDGMGVFEHVADSLGIAGPTLKPLGFGTKWLDMDNDGWPDLSYANGHVYDNTNEIDPLSSYREPLMLFHNDHGAHFEDLVPRMDPAIAKPIVGRGSATGDFDNDGRMDLLVVDYEGSPLLLHNQSQTANHWITLDLRGLPPNRFAYGAEVSARTGNTVWVGQVSPASSYLSSSDPRIHFGLGPITRLDSLRIRWPDGRTDVFRGVSADRILRVEERPGQHARIFAWRGGAT